MMKSKNGKLLFAFVLCTVSWSCVQADNQVTVTRFNVDLPDNDVFDSWDHDLSDNLLGSTINVKSSCPSVIEANVKVYQGGNMVNEINKKLEKPIKDFESYNICGEVDSPEIEDDDCSMAQGEQVAKDCDVSQWFKNMSPGDYSAECELLQNGASIVNMQLDVKVESG